MMAEEKKQLYLQITAALLAAVFCVLLAFCRDNAGVLSLPAEERGVSQVADPQQLSGRYADRIAFSISGEIGIQTAEGEPFVYVPAGTRSLTLQETVSLAEGGSYTVIDRNPAYLREQYLVVEDRVQSLLVEAVPPGDYNDSASNEQIESRKETYPRYDLSRISFSDFRIENELQFNPYLSLFVFMTVLCLALLWLLAKRLWKKPELAFLLVMLTLGTAMAVCLPRNKVGYDEETHLQAVMELASLPGTLHISDAVVNQLMVTDYNDPNTQPGALEEMQLFDRYLSDHGNYKSGENAPDFQVLPNRAPAYLSMALFVKLAKGLSLSWPMLILLGRLGNLLCYTGLMYAAIRKTPVGKYLMLLIGLFPQNVFLAATFSYDPFVTGCLFLGIAAWLKALWQEAGRPFDSKNAALMLGAFFLGCLPKAVYAPLLLLALLIPGNRFATARGRGLYRAAVLGLFALLIGSFILPTAVAPAETGDLRGGETSEVSQVGYILADPFGYLALLLSQMLRWLPQSFFGADCTTFMGHLVNGYTEFRGFWPLYVGLLLLYVLRGEKSSRTFSRMERIAVFLCTGAACALIWTSMYVAFTEPGAREIAGVQGRYFIPLMFLFYLFFALRRPGKEKPSPEQEGAETKGGNLARPRLLWYHLWVSIPAAALAATLWVTVVSRFLL